MTSLLLDEMFSGAIAEQLRAKGYDVLAVVTDPTLLGLPDDEILAYATDTGRALVTANIKDFMPLEARYRAASQTHAGLILVSPKTATSVSASPARYQSSSANPTRSSRGRSSSSRADKRLSASSLSAARLGQPTR
jgi:hypothetical protein